MEGRRGTGEQQVREGARPIKRGSQCGGRGIDGSEPQQSRQLSHSADMLRRPYPAGTSKQPFAVEVSEQQAAEFVPAVQGLAQEAFVSPGCFAQGVADQAVSVSRHASGKVLMRPFRYTRRHDLYTVAQGLHTAKAMHSLHAPRGLRTSGNALMRRS